MTVFSRDSVCSGDWKDFGYGDEGGYLNTALNSTRKVIRSLHGRDRSTTGDLTLFWVAARLFPAQHYITHPHFNMDYDTGYVECRPIST